MKPLKIVIIGHVDHGKSTLTGKLLVETGAVSDSKLEQIKKICAASGKRFEYAFILDALEEEQRQGITIDLVRVPFKTQKREYELIDAPGHKEFLKNMVSGASDADVAVVIIDANEGIREQSLRHGRIVALLGISQVIVLMNKMDIIGYDKNTYATLKTAYEKHLRNIGISHAVFVPVSALEGDNLFAKSDRMPWYSGKTFIDSLDSLQLASDLTTQPFRMPVQDVYKFDDRRIIAGQIVSGKAKVGDQVIFLPSGKSGVIKSFEAWNRKPTQEAFAKQSIGITLEEQVFIERGETCIHPDKQMRTTDVFRANIIWLSDEHLRKNKTYRIRIGTQETGCQLIRIENNSLEAPSSVELHNIEIAKNEIAQVVFSTDTPICYDCFSDIRETGRFVLTDGADISGGGTISSYQTIFPDFVI